MRITTFAAIYVGSYEVSLKITEISAKRKIRAVSYTHLDVYKRQDMTDR